MKISKFKVALIAFMVNFVMAYVISRSSGEPTAVVFNRLLMQQTYIFVVIVLIGIEEIINKDKTNGTD